MTVRGVLLLLVCTLRVGALWAPCSRCSTAQNHRRASGAVCKAPHAGRRPRRVSQLVQNELSGVIRTSTVRGSRKIDGRLRQMISVVDVDVSPDLTQAQVKVSIIGDQKDKISAIRWLQGNSGGLRYALAKKMSGSKRVPRLQFQHIDVSRAVDVMIKLDQLSEERRTKGSGSNLDFDASEEDAFAEYDGGDESDDADEEDDELDFDFSLDEDEDDASLFQI